MAEEYRKLVHLCARSGSESDWNTANPILLQGEIGISTSARMNYITQETDRTIMKIGDGSTDWKTLGLDSEGQDDNSVFFAGRGAGLLPAAADNENGTGAIGGIKLFFNEKSLTLDEMGHLSFRKRNSDGSLSKTTQITVDEIHVGSLYAKTLQTELTAANMVILREEATSGLGNSFSGIAVAKIQDFDGENTTIDAGFITSSDGKWYAATRPRTKTTNEEGVAVETTGTWTTEGTLVLMNPDFFSSDGSQAVTMYNGQLEPWTPNKLTLTINNDETTQVEYNPLTNGEIPFSFNIPTLNKISVRTYEAESENEIAVEDYEIDAEGNILLELPIPTAASVDNWNNKMTSWFLSGHEIINQGVVNFADSDIAVDENHVITFPYVKKVIFNEEELAVNEGQVTITPVYTSVTTPANNDVEISSTTRADKGTEYTVKHKVIAANGTELRVDNLLSSEELVVISSLDMNNGHIVGYTQTTYGIKDLINKINDLEARLSALEGK